MFVKNTLIDIGAVAYEYCIVCSFIHVKQRVCVWNEIQEVVTETLNNTSKMTVRLAEKKI